MDEQLFIIGNGFDLAHGMQTRYTEFREYLEENQNISRVWALYNLLNERIMGEDEWNNFESTLGFLYFEDELNPYIKDIKNGDDENYIAIDNMNTAVKKCSGVIDQLGEIFSEWVSTIKMPLENRRIGDFYDLVHNYKNHFLSFNYTDTLKLLYQINDVCHIHGSFGLDEELLVGHGEAVRNIESELYNGDVLVDYTGENHSTYAENLAIRQSFDLIHNRLKKDVAMALSKHADFFSDLGNIKRIYSFGFSYGDADLPYIREIIQNINNISSVEWFLNDYDNKKNTKFEDKIKACGFNGKFRRYSC